MPPATRRDRRRIETIAEIKATALRHLIADGVDAVSLRAIARDLGMASGSAYNYFETREALLAAVAVDLRADLARGLADARATAADAHGELLAHGTAYREWALTHPNEFRLIFSAAAQHADATGDYDLCLGLVGLAATARPAEGGHSYDWSDMNMEFTAIARERFPDLQPTTLALALRIWGRMHGLVTLEIDGVLRPQISNPAMLYHEELEALSASLGLTT
ncbi:TetR/AcrR family transcriptional regulator [Nocardia uniformis]|uniref:TetR/AcrR family transcriptional regulator n=1 Tax=Nocardia uniformis TaxID=53432 RepID=A0A849C5I2_9NOCA|nr:TetR/AcrR family transcriptional regulator [Nocardia uniformis]NNH71077.1 TetR/AcrR family transcriptional regulator [Nocardia uniformis]